SALDFGALPISMTGMMTLTVSNTGGGTLNITSITPTAGVFVASPADMIVDPGATQDLTVTFTPDAVGTFTDDLIIISDADSSPDTVSLDGSGAASSGGPDIAGYTWVNSYDAAGPAYAWIDTTDAIDAIIAYGDDYRGTIDLPFLFRFYGNVYSQITATTNGWIGMGPSSGYSSSYWTNETILDASTPNNIIAPFWDDLKAGDAPGSTSSYMGTILYKTVGVAPDRQFVVIFQDVVRSYGDTDGFTFEVIFDETTSDITLQYADVTGNASADNGIGATVGIENADGTDGLLYNYNGAPNLLYDDLAIYFEAPAAPATPGMVLDIQEYDFDVVPVGFGASLDVTIINDGGADLVVTGATVNAPFSTAFSGTIPALQSAVATIDFDPATVGTFAEVLTFAVTGAYTGSDTVALAGSSYAVHAALDEGFEGGTFPPADWSVTTTDASGDAWEAANDGSSHGPGTVAEGTLAAMADIYNMSSGTVSHMYSPAADLSGMSAPRLSFWWQCMTGSGTQPSLTVNYSIDGGSTWSELYYQEADGTADDWVNVKVFLPEFSAGTMFDFVAFSDYGSYNMFLDAVLVEEGPVLTPFFSEYMEGSGNNKGLEIYNATGADIDLDEYQIAQSVNGGGWQYYHAFPAGATLANGDLWLIVTDAAFPEMIAMADEVLGYPSVVNHNGDDARALIKIVGTDTTFMDVIGIPTEDPGSGWDVAGVAVG
ncbi:MAG: choice-of-anchor D domain-containing protein, partial [Candidatus Marinimicrobia bacterium]|nr:choice-of-anchor D domain-containing protein [Candidatus Neomarinimicrobiota bacterium]